MDLSKYLQSNECVELTSKQAAILSSPGVYIYVDAQGMAAYVGSSVCMLHRASRKDHAHVKTAFNSIVFIPCKSLELARELEQELIFDLQPTLNKRGGVAKFAKELGFSSVSSACRYFNGLKLVLYD